MDFFVSFQSMGNGFQNFTNMELTIVFIDGWFLFSNFQSFSDFLLQELWNNNNSLGQVKPNGVRRVVKNMMGQCKITIFLLKLCLFKASINGISMYF